MKKLLSILIFSASLLFFACTGSKTSAVEVSAHVWGNCDKCKATIEKSCAMDGVSEAVWNEDSKLLTLKLDTSLVTLSTVLQTVSKAGYDNEMFYADDYAYNKLPDCCQYDRRPFESK
jgi:mercuric ion binding protein